MLDLGNGQAKLRGPSNGGDILGWNCYMSFLTNLVIGGDFCTESVGGRNPRLNISLCIHMEIPKSPFLSSS